MGDALKENYGLLPDRKQHKLNKTISRDNLLIFRNIFNYHNVKFCICFGTLMGAVREGNFIEGDDDTDVVTLYEDRNRVMLTLPDLNNWAFEIISLNDGLLQLKRYGEYLDVFFYKKSIFGYRYKDWHHIPGKYLESFDSMEFLGVQFNVPKDPIKFLEDAYGEWTIPTKENADRMQGRIYKITKAVKEVLGIKRILPRGKQWY